MQEKEQTLTQELIDSYAAHLRETEKAGHTVQKYRHDLAALYRWLGGRALTKAVLIEWKEHLSGSVYSLSFQGTQTRREQKTIHLVCLRYLKFSKGLDCFQK